MKSQIEKVNEGEIRRESEGTIGSLQFLYYHEEVTLGVYAIYGINMIKISNKI